MSYFSKPAHLNLSYQLLPTLRLFQGIPRASSTLRSSHATPEHHTLPASLPIPRVILKGGKSKLFTDSSQGNPTIYSGAIDRVLGRPAPTAGALVLVCNGAEEPFAWGVYNPSSMYRVRIIETHEQRNPDSPFDPSSPPDMDDLVHKRIHQAAALRSFLLGLRLPATSATSQTPTTTVYRLVNSEADRLSGCVVDMLGDVAVVQASAVWIQQRQGTVEAAVRDATGVTHIVWRRGKELSDEEGWTSDDPGEAIDNQQRDDETAEAVSVLENGIRYFADPFGQKTGFYADQRDNRLFIRSIVAGKRVLDLFCYSGGFALNAVAGGASEVTGVDSSTTAVDLARRNAQANAMHLEGGCTFERSDAGEFMKGALAAGMNWDVVILDPPKLAPSRKSLPAALRKYESLNVAAMRLVRPGGLLMSCSCSGAVAHSGEFVPMLQRAARRAHRRITIVRVAGAAPDHPIDPGYPEGQYLTNVTVRVN